MEAVYAPGSYEAARAEADAEMAEFKLPEGARFELQELP